jgi:putative nucleotidyltransferase with HDIG domain
LVILEPEEVELFDRLSPAEQDHAFRVMKNVSQSEAVDRDVLSAALLHDVGKSRVPTTLSERSFAVIISTLMPNVASQLSQGEPRGWRRPFVVKAQHAAWGAELAAKAGSSLKVVSLIRRHQDEVRYEQLDDEDYQLGLLQRADNQN